MVLPSLGRSAFPAPLFIANYSLPDHCNCENLDTSTHDRDRSRNQAVLAASTEPTRTPRAQLPPPMQSSLALLLAGACAAPPSIPGWRYAAGSLAHGNDAVVVNTTLSKAMAMCAASSPASICCGVTFKGRDPAPGATVIVEARLKTSCQLYPARDRDPAWNTWFNLAQPGRFAFLRIHWICLPPAPSCSALI